jgi:iron complex outermembrane receptor protein
MDGVKFDRENVALRFERKALGEHVTKLEAQAYYNYVDHVMDNYSLRDFMPSMTMPNPSVSNPDRRTTGGKVQADVSFGRDVTATVGVDLQENRHTLRSTMNETTMPYESMSRVEDARFRNAGLFGEMKVPVGEGGRVIAGLRADDWYAKDARQMLSLGMTRVANPTAGDERNQTLFGGFGRYERDLSTSPVTLYAGVGHVERFPDYWELISATKESATSLSAFNTRPEKTTQLDIGALYASSRLSLSVSMFLSDVQDFILIQSNYRKGMRYATISRNVDARTWGGEADALYKVTDHLKLTATLAYTRGDNRTDDAPLAQIPPLEGRLGLDYTRGKWSVGTLFRAVDNQDRYVVNQGNIVGQDLGPTPGFAVLSLNAGWHPSKTVLVTAGIDNLFDRTYAEHLSRSGAMVPGYLQTTRVNEPGQTLWMKVNLTY